MTKWKLICAFGIITCLTWAVLMAFGEAIVGQNYVAVATTIGITGICLITTGNKKEGL